jgi:hypothetical protein
MCSSAKHGPPQYQLPPTVYRLWIRRREEDSGDNEVYRPRDAAVAYPAGLDGFEITPEGEFVLNSATPAGRSTHTRGRWRLLGPNLVAVTFADSARPDYAFEIVSADEHVLRIKPHAEPEAALPVAPPGAPTSVPRPDEPQPMLPSGAPATASDLRIEFERAEIVTLGTSPPRYVLNVSGTKPFVNMEVGLAPVAYVRRPEYWGVEVVGHLQGIGIPDAAPFEVTLDVTGVMGTKGVEVQGATRSAPLVPAAADTTATSVWEQALSRWDDQEQEAERPAEQYRVSYLSNLLKVKEDPAVEQRLMAHLRDADLAAEQRPATTQDVHSIAEDMIGGSLGESADTPSDEPADGAGGRGADETVTCHLRAEADDEVVLGRVTTVAVTVSRERIDQETGAAAAEGSAEVDPRRRLSVQVIPKARLEIVGPSEADVDPPAVGKPVTVNIDVRPTGVGEAEVWVIIRQGQALLTTLKLRPRVVRTRARRMAAAGQVAQDTVPWLPPLTQPLHQLWIHEETRGAGQVYVYRLESPSLDIRAEYTSKVIEGSREAYVGRKYQDLERRWVNSQGDAAEFIEELREFGGDLLGELFPEELQQVLWDNREHLTSVQIMADEPFIPWELVHLREPGRPFPDETWFLGQMGATRWLLDGGWQPTRLRARPGRVRYVIPTSYANQGALPQAPEERRFLEKRFGATAVEPPQPDPVRHLLEAPGAFDLLHFSCHGDADSDSIGEAQLELQERVEHFVDGGVKSERHLPTYLKMGTVEQRANLKAPDGSRPVVVLNACRVARAGLKLTRTGGFAQAFLRGKAGAFVGPLWNAGDVPARAFVEAWYDNLLGGATVAQATIAARAAARKAAGDATWLAFVVYAHPQATMTTS